MSSRPQQVAHVWVADDLAHLQGDTHRRPLTDEHCSRTQKERWSRAINGFVCDSQDLEMNLVTDQQPIE